MVIYLDLVFLLNSTADAFALYVTSRLSGLALRPARVLIASLLGGVYGVVCSVPSFCSIGSIVPQILVAAVLVWVVFGIHTIYLRLCLLFFVLSCAMGGVLIAFAQAFTIYGVSDTLHSINWKVFFLVGGMCYFLLSIVFRGSAKHFVSGEISNGSIFHNGRNVFLNVLIDTGHTLRDPYSGNQVMTVWLDSTRGLWSSEEWNILSRLRSKGIAPVFEELAQIAPGKFRLIPYRAVGVDTGSLICFTADNAVVGNKTFGKISVALSFTPLSDGGNCNALWGAVD